MRSREAKVDPAATVNEMETLQQTAHLKGYTVLAHHERRTIMAQVKKYAPFLTTRWWVLHTAAIAAVYAAGHLLAGG